MPNQNNQPGNQTQSHYDLLFRYIRRNKELKKAIANVAHSENEREQANQLLVAIQKGDFNASVFQNDKVDIFLLYLIKENKINPDNPDLNFWPGMTVYLYILALRQYGNLPLINWENNTNPVNEKHDVKIERGSFFSNGKLTPEGEYYLTSLRKGLHNEDNGGEYDLEIKLDIQHVSDYIRGLPLVEQSLMKLTNTRGSELLEIVTRLFPFINPEWFKDNSSGTAYIPSLSVINYLYGLQSPRPVKTDFGFGCVSVPTVRARHEERIHPGALHSNLVKSNTQAHRSKDAFAMAIHDLLHTFMANLLSLDEYDFLFKSFIPQLTKWKETADQGNDLEFSKDLLLKIERCIDLDFTHKRLFAERPRLQRFLHRHVYDDNENKERFFLLTTAAYFNHAGGEKEKYYWFQFFVRQLNFFLNDHHEQADYILVHAVLIVLSKDANLVKKWEEKLEELRGKNQLTHYDYYLKHFFSKLKNMRMMDYNAALDEVKKICEDYNEYELALMSSLPENDPNKAEKGKIYLSQEGDNHGEYCLRDDEGIVRYGTFNKYDLKNQQGDLNGNLKNRKFIRKILETTSNAGHTPTEYHVPGSLLTFLVSETSTKQLGCSDAFLQQFSFKNRLQVQNNQMDNLSSSEYQFLFHGLIPKLAEWKQIADQYNDVIWSKQLLKGIDNCISLDFSSYDEKVDSRYRLEKHLDNTLRSHNYRNEFFLLAAVTYFNHTRSEEEKYYWFQFFACELYKVLSYFPGAEHRKLTMAILIVLSNDPDIVKKWSKKYDDSDEDKLTRYDHYLENSCSFLNRYSNMDYDTALNTVKTFRNDVYELVLMSSLPGNDINKAEKGKIYLSQEGKYVVLNGTMSRTGEFDKKLIKAGGLENTLKDVEFIADVLRIISDAGNIRKKYPITEALRAHILKGSVEKQLESMPTILPQQLYSPFWRKQPEQHNQQETQVKVSTQTMFSVGKK